VSTHFIRIEMRGPYSPLAARLDDSWSSRARLIFV
jgi:hypothetical protein